MVLPRHLNTFSDFYNYLKSKVNNFSYKFKAIARLSNKMQSKNPLRKRYLYRLRSSTCVFGTHRVEHKYRANCCTIPGLNETALYAVRELEWVEYTNWKVKIDQLLRNAAVGVSLIPLDHALTMLSSLFLPSYKQCLSCFAIKRVILFVS